MDNLDFAGGTLCLSKATLAAGTTTTWSTTGSTIYAIKGKAYTTSAAANAASPTTDGNTGLAFTTVPLSYGSVFVFAYDGSSTTAASAIKVYQGSVEALQVVGASGAAAADGANALFQRAPQFPSIPDTVCPFGYMVVKVGSSGTAFTFGTSNLAAVSNVSKSFQDVILMPPRPQVA